MLSFTMATDTHYETDSAVIAIGEGLKAKTLPKAHWTHAAHVAAALRLLGHHSAGEAAALMPPLIRADNESTGVANTDHGGYHHNITLASWRGAAAFLQAHPGRSLSAACNALLDTPLQPVGLAVRVLIAPARVWRRSTPCRT